MTGLHMTGPQDGFVYVVFALLSLIATGLSGSLREGTDD